MNVRPFREDQVSDYRVCEITYSDGVADDLGCLTANERAEILDRIEVQST